MIVQVDIDRKVVRSALPNSWFVKAHSFPLWMRRKLAWWTQGYSDGYHIEIVIEISLTGKDFYVYQNSNVKLLATLPSGRKWLYNWLPGQGASSDQCNLCKLRLLTEHNIRCLWHSPWDPCLPGHPVERATLSFYSWIHFFESTVIMPWWLHNCTFIMLECIVGWIYLISFWSRHSLATD